MDLQEYRQYIINDCIASSESNGTSAQDEFVLFTKSMFEDTEEVLDLVPCEITCKGEHNKKIQLDGYAFDNSDKSFILFVSKFEFDEELTTITKTEIDGFIKSMKSFVEGSISRFIQKNTEQSSEAFQLADLLVNRFQQGHIMKFKFYISTNCKLSDKVKKITVDDIFDKKVEVNVWDITRLFNADVNNRQKESIEIDIKKYCNGNGIPAIKAYEGEADEYTAYLAVIPGEFLAQIYDEYGSRLLEGNVRSFLNATGKVNKGIRNTILKEPKYFFTYNNGIATTASDLEIKMTTNGIEITKLKDLQIINGGQTTASLLNTKINYKGDLKNIYVPMKLTVIKTQDFNKFSKTVENISRYANSQNKVSEADFFANSAFHIRFEKLSKSIMAPAVNGNQYQTVWFYERARGAYRQEQMKMTKAQINKFKAINPKNQMITKTDLAKYMNSYNQRPHIVSRGAQRNMKEFAEDVKKIEEKSIDNINEYFFKQAIALAIIFRGLEIEISKATWFPQGSGYRANIVTYSIAKLFYCLEKQCKGYSLNFEKIWNKQKMYPELRRVLMEIAKDTFEFINLDSRPIMNVTEWCKKEQCWESYKKVEFDLPNYFIMTLEDTQKIKDIKTNARKEQKEINNIDRETQVVMLGSAYWQRLMKKAKSMGICSLQDEADLRIAIRMETTGRPPNSVQAKRLLLFREKCSIEGLDIENI